MKNVNRTHTLTPLYSYVQRLTFAVSVLEGRGKYRKSSRQDRDRDSARQISNQRFSNKKREIATKIGNLDPDVRHCTIELHPV